MIAFPAMLVRHAESAGIPTPPDSVVDDIESFREDYPRFYLLCRMQLGRAIPMPPGDTLSNNVQVIADIPEEKLKTITAGQILEQGFR